MQNNQTAQAPVLTKISCDQEAWLRDRLTDLVLLCFDINANKKISANDDMIEGAFEGAINRQALEIIKILNLKTDYTNLPRRTWWFSDRKSEIKKGNILSSQAKPLPDK